MKFNINDIVRVKLTDYGLGILKSRYRHLNKQSNGLISYDNIIGLKEDGMYETETWQLMQDFGNCMYMGNNEMCFENNIIEVLK